MGQAARWAVVGLVGLAVAAPLHAQQDQRQQRIQASIARGVEYLKAKQGGDGGWVTGTGAAVNYGIGPTALVGIALMECGVPANDPAIQKAALVVRGGALRETRTYQLSLALQFLDRMGEFNDEPLIQVLALRLML